MQTNTDCKTLKAYTGIVNRLGDALTAYNAAMVEHRDFVRSIAEAGLDLRELTGGDIIEHSREELLKQADWCMNLAGELPGKARK